MLPLPSLCCKYPDSQVSSNLFLYVPSNQVLLHNLGSVTMVWRSLKLRRWPDTSQRMRAQLQTSSLIGTLSILKNLKLETLSPMAAISFMSLGGQPKKNQTRRSAPLPNLSQRERNSRSFSSAPLDSVTKIFNTSFWLWSLTLAFPWTETSRFLTFRTTSSLETVFVNSKASLSRTEHWSSSASRKVVSSLKMFSQSLTLSAVCLFQQIKLKLTKESSRSVMQSLKRTKS